IMSILFDKEGEIKGFAWGILTDCEDIQATDVPFSFTRNEQEKACVIARYWFLTVKKKKVLIFSEIGIRNDVHGHLATYLVQPMTSFALSQGFTSMFYWTSTKSRAFQLGVMVGWSPFHYFGDTKDLV
ncbi:MAG: hypothetical protein AAB870_01320, partial [Patescibacteria group bacterium]